MSGVVSIRPEFQQIINADSRPEKVASGFVFTEGPVWSSRDRALTFSDIPADTMYRWSEAGGVVLFRRPSDGANGNTIDAQGRLLTCEHTNRHVSRTSEAGTIEALADLYQGKRLNSPNDVIVAANGDVFFTDPPYGLRQADGSLEGGELSFFGVYRWAAASNDLTLLVDDFVRPNGLAMADDDRLLYIADTDQAHIRVFDVNAAGTLDNGRIFAETVHEGVRARPDGIKLDERGNLYVTSSRPEGVWVYDPAGRLLGQIAVGENPANAAFGGDDWQTLFVTAQTSVYRVRLKVRGQRVGHA